MEENTSKVFVADANLAAATLMTASGTGTSLFVINLCASMAPLANVGKTLPGLESYRLYQVARREDGRTRYRLRLGFFTSEADAEAVLNVVRDSHPTAFTTCLCDEDRKFTRGFVPEPSAAPKIAMVAESRTVAKAAVVTPPTPAASLPPKAASAAPAPTPKAPSPSQTMSAQKTGTSQSKPSPAASTAAAVKTKPMQPVAKAPSAAREALTEIELSWDPPASSVPAPATNAEAAQIVAPASTTQQVIKGAPRAASMAPAAKSNTEAKPVAAKQTIEPPSKLLATIELSLETEQAAPQAAPKKAPSNEPFRVGRGVDIPATSLTLEAASPAAQPSTPPSAAKSSAQAAPKPASNAAAEISRLKAAQASAPAAIRDAVAPGAAKPGAKLPDLDSTQTIRALTSDELQDDAQEKWFSIQLAVSDQPVNLDAMPRLDIFEAYRLYSVASAGSGKITHSLRIGFFREEVSAEAVCGYLKTFFNSPSVVRISIAEHSRFKDPPVAKPAPKADVLDLSHARERAPKSIPTVTMAVDTPRFDPNATGSFKASATGAHKALTATGTHRVLGATGTHKALKAASKSAPPATRRSAPLPKTSATGKHKSLQSKKSLSQQLLEEAREVELSESGIRKLPKNDSLLSRMFGKKKS